MRSEPLYSIFHKDDGKWRAWGLSHPKTLPDIRCNSYDLCRPKADKMLHQLREGELFCYKNKTSYDKRYEQFVYRWTSEQVVNHWKIRDLREDMEWMYRAVRDGETIWKYVLEDRRARVAHLELESRYFVPVGS